MFPLASSSASSACASPARPVTNAALHNNKEEGEDVAGGGGSASSRVIVLHPGSRSLRLGRASDAAPATVLHAVARKRRVRRDLEEAKRARTAEGEHRDPFAVRKACLDGAALRRLSGVETRARSSLQTGLRSDGSRRFGVPREHLRALNQKSKPRKVTVDEEEKSEKEEECQETVVGEKVLEVGDYYNIHFPFKRGETNQHPGIGGSRSSVLADLDAIWSSAIESELGVGKDDLKNYRAVLIIPALYDRPLIKHLVTLLLDGMGFKGCFVLQDHVAATFGAGLGYACVVDIGDQKTSVSCVEDGVSHLESRIHLDYGGADIAQVFYHFLLELGLSYDACDSSSRGRDLKILQRLTEDSCHLDLDRCGMEQRTITVRDDDSNSAMEHDVHFADEAILAPSALFETGFFAVVEGKKQVRFMPKDPGDPEDPHDHNYLFETSRKYTRAVTGGDGVEQQTGDGEDEDLEIVADVDDKKKSEPFKKKGTSSDDSSFLLPLDQAIVKSVESCQSDEAKRKMFGNILLVGGGAKIPGLEAYLSSRLALQVPAQFRGEAMEVTANAKDAPADVTCWRGAAVMATLETAQELWITPAEWRKLGQKMLRERAPFPWA